MLPDRLLQSQPGTLGTLPARDRRRSEVEDDESKASADQDLRRILGLFEILGTKPQQTIEQDSGSSCRLGVEMVTEIHEGDGLAEPGRRRQGGQDRGVATAAVTADQFDEFTPCKAASEDSVHRVESGGQLFVSVFTGSVRIEKFASRPKVGLEAGWKSDC